MYMHHLWKYFLAIGSSLACREGGWGLALMCWIGAYCNTPLLVCTLINYFSRLIVLNIKQILPENHCV